MLAKLIFASSMLVAVVPFVDAVSAAQMLDRSDAGYVAGDQLDVGIEDGGSTFVTTRKQPNRPGDLHESGRGEVIQGLTLAGLDSDHGSGDGGPGGQGSRWSPKIGFIGDSLMVATHADHMCENRSILDCIEDKMGVHDLEWGHGGGDKPWSLASFFGYAPEEVINAAEDGAQWRNALEQAQKVMSDENVDAVVINMGTNDACAEFGHDYAGDLMAIEGNIDDVLTHLSDELPEGSEIHILSVSDIVSFRDMMVNRDHNHMFENCQAAWDLDEDKVKYGAALDACVDLFGGFVCELIQYVDDAIEYLVEQVLDYYFDAYGIDEGPCGKVLSSKSTDQDRVEAAAFNLALNELLELKAEEYNDINGLRVFFSRRVYQQSSSLKPYHISRLDCFHPSRVGQMHLAMQVSEDLDMTYVPAERVFFDAFDSLDYCNQEFTVWPSCWVDVLDGNPLFGDVQIEDQQLMVRDDDTIVWRKFDLLGQTEAWLQIMYRRDDIGNDEDVRAQVSTDGGLSWTTVAYYDDGEDEGDHRGHYFALSSFPFGSDVRLRFISSSGLEGDEKIYFDNVKIFSW